jgi:hypothetical protein
MNANLYLISNNQSRLLESDDPDNPALTAASGDTFGFSAVNVDTALATSPGSLIARPTVHKDSQYFTWKMLKTAAKAQAAQL